MSKFEQKIDPDSAVTINSLLWRYIHSKNDIAYQIDLCGSWLRGKQEIGDLDVMVELKPSYTYKDFIKATCTPTSWFKCIRSGERHVTLVTSGMAVRTQVDVYFFKNNEWAPAKMFLTGSGKHNMKLRLIAKKKGYKLNQYGLWDGDKRIDNNTEPGIYRLLGVKYVEPWDRIDGSELEDNIITKWNPLPKTVVSSDGVTLYNITNGQCSCPGFKYRHTCKHIKEMA